MSWTRALTAIVIAAPLAAVDIVGDITGGGGRSANLTVSVVGAVRAIGGTIGNGSLTMIAAPTGGLVSTPIGTGSGGTRCI